MVNQSRCWRTLILVCACTILATTALLLVIPAADAVRMSISPKHALAGYREALRDPSFAAALRSSFLYVLVTLPAQLIVGIACALHVYLSRRPLAWFMIYFLPYSVPVYAGVIAWRWMLDRSGFVAQAAAHAGIPAEAWLGKYAALTLCMVSVWHFYPFVFASILARLHRTPPALHATAAIDRVSTARWVAVVAWPQLRGTLLVVAVLRVAFMAAKFDVPWLLISSGATPAGRVLTVFIAERVGTDPIGGIGIATAIMLAVGLALGFLAAAPLLAKNGLREVRNES